MNRFEKAIRVLLGKRLPAKVTYTITANINPKKVPKNKWTFVTCELAVDEVGEHWIVKTSILPEDQKLKLIRPDLFIGSLDEITMHNRKLTKKQINKIKDTAGGKK